AEAIGSVRDRLPRLAHLLRADAFDRLAAASPHGAVHTQRGGEDLAVLMYTSGTSGLPRGAMLPHRAMLTNLDQCARIEPPVVTADDVVLLALPLFHIYGLGPGLGQVARVGCSAVLVDRFDPAETLELIARHGVTNVPGAPPMFVAWSLLPDFAEVFGNVRLAVSGAAPLPPEAQARMFQATGRHIYEGYGLTETAPVVTSTLVSEVPKPSSIGQPIPGVDVRLVDPATGEDLVELTEDLRELLDEVDAPIRDPGEVVVRGANLFVGYWPDGEGGPDAQGWWRTGDVAVSDEDGDLYLVDRIKELILVSGFNVYPREVEAVLVAHPGIVEAAVIGVPDPSTGETVKAYVVTAPGVQITAEEVVAHAERSLARFKCPTVVDVVVALPHSATGKVSKGRLRAREARAAGS
ncbi:MAG TPA: AMP-binding protein, partial [Cryptosporangiaceae bacterium]|nr:AMP-binding protein [Cryptosporangiaceae bacterium]